MGWGERIVYVLHFGVRKAKLEGIRVILGLKEFFIADMNISAQALPHPVMLIICCTSLHEQENASENEIT